MLSQFQQVFSVYEQALSSTAVTAENKRNIAICEGRLTWLVHMVAACIESQSNSDSMRRTANNELVLDGQLSRWVFNLALALDNRLNNTQGAGKCDEKLELAVLNFFKAFKKSYLLESASSLSLAAPAVAVAVPGGSPAHPLLSMALASYRSGEDKESAEVVSVSIAYCVCVYVCDGVMVCVYMCGCM